MIRQSKTLKLDEIDSPLLIPVYKDQKLELFDYDLNDEIDKDFGKVNKVLTLGTKTYPHVYFLGLGEEDKLDYPRLKEAFALFFKNNQEDKLTVYLDKLKLDAQDSAKALVLGANLSTYDYKKYDQEKTNEIELISKEDLSETINKSVVLVNAINNARQLANTPSNLLNPLDLEMYILKTFSDKNVEITIHDNKSLEALKAGGILGVNKGSDTEARLFVLKYNGAKDKDYTALIGKGITFDTGGYNLKPSVSMGNMKTDMHGAASVLGAFEVIVKNKLDANVYCIIPSTENMIDGSAFKADDVLTMLNGKTVEITNTDAEGRLVLADAISHAQDLNIKRLIDVATLTGACVVGLGSDHTGVWSNDEDFYQEFDKASKKTHELIWRMPLHDVFSEVLKSSTVADIVNSAAPKGGGANVAASFLEVFVNEGTSWIHLDIAGSSSTKTGSNLNPKGATGVMVETLANLFE